tara:strand:+ start:401 stop:502 length:102 start_codon:yes stop_codon:yes gene_type:complete
MSRTGKDMPEYRTYPDDESRLQIDKLRKLVDDY